MIRPVGRALALLGVTVLLGLAGCGPPRLPEVVYFIPVPSTERLSGYLGTARGVVAAALPELRQIIAQEDLEVSAISGVRINRDGRNTDDPGSGWVLQVFSNQARQGGNVSITSRSSSYTLGPLDRLDRPIPPWTVDSDGAIQRADPDGRFSRYVLLLGGFVRGQYNDPSIPVLWQIGDSSKTSGFSEFVDANRDVRTDSSGYPL